MTITAEELAQTVAEQIKIRDDIADAHIVEDDPTVVLVRTQGNKPFVIYVEEGAEATAGMGEDPQQG